MKGKKETDQADRIDDILVLGDGGIMTHDYVDSL